ncbi:DNA-binding protein [Streptococcus sp. sy004]|uniref:DNA-binding protein n=1 Tax=Streptococcus sp. sy004 TaxID=2600149 RepID=UPI0011B51D32|nr:DNA-binding protein [Streptococcus sp. sy004]TWT12052.1 DNA-binding protein [Streptococcus sp. sy004]
MDELLESLTMKFQDRLTSAALSASESALNYERTHFPLELTKKQVCQMIGGNMDVTTFDARFNCFPDFPRITGKGREKYPRDAVIEWYAKNWQRLSV